MAVTPKPGPAPAGGAGSAVHAAHGGHRGDKAPGLASAGQAEVLGLGLQERGDALERAGGLQAQRVHHVDQVVCGRGGRTQRQAGGSPRCPQAPEAPWLAPLL